jgi:protease-4
VEIPPRKALQVGFLLFAVLALGIFAVSYMGVHVVPSMARDEVALVRLEGPILDVRGLVDTVRDYGRDSRVKALVLRVDSPGGGVVPSQELYDSLVAFKKTGKKVVTSMGTVAASGGYYVAAASDLIVANPGTLTGSIGVIMSLANVEKLLDKVGISAVTITAGKHKDMGSPFRALTPEERALLQNVMDDIHNQFIQAVADGRGRPVEEIRALADGRVFSGRQAIQAGLVDELGDLQQAIQRAGELAGIPGKPRVVEQQPPLWERLLGEPRTWFPWLPRSAASLTGPQAMYLMTF